MEKKEIIILDKGLKDLAGPEGVCCHGSLVPYRNE
jgi:hypothetical protein